MIIKRYQGFTLIELIVILIIISILAAMALPMFAKTLETNRGQEAVAALRQIRTAERIYRTKEEFYYPHCVVHPGAESNVDTIRDVLKIFLEKRADRNWDLSIDTDALNSFSATATRISGAPGYQGGKIMIDQDGKLTSQGWPLPVPEE